MCWQRFNNWLLGEVGCPDVSWFCWSPLCKYFSSAWFQATNMMSADLQKTRKLDNQFKESVEAGLACYCQCLLSAWPSGQRKTPGSGFKGAWSLTSPYLAKLFSCIYFHKPPTLTNPAQCLHSFGSLPWLRPFSDHLVGAFLSPPFACFTHFPLWLFPYNSFKSRTALPSGKDWHSVDCIQVKNSCSFEVTVKKGEVRAGVWPSG